MKYIVCARKGIILFSHKIKHELIAQQTNAETISAGRIEWSEEKKQFHCLGRSETLNINSRPEEDTCLLWESGLLIPSTPQY